MIGHVTFKSCFNFSKNNWKQSISQILQSNFWRFFKVWPNSAACLAMSHDWKFFKGKEWNLGPQGRWKLCKFEFFCTWTHPARFLIFCIRLKLRFVCWIWGSGSLAYPGEGLCTYPVLPIKSIIIVDFQNLKDVKKTFQFWLLFHVLFFSIFS